ncbi:hypothetical protein ACS0TY_030671 [Phlomoides rotata]
MQGHIDVTMRLLGHRGFDPRTYNLPSVAEVVAVIPGDLDKTIGVRDIILQTQSGLLQRITELNPSYLALQYPILFPYAEDGYREDIPFAESQLQRAGNRTGINLREFFHFVSRKGYMNLLRYCWEMKCNEVLIKIPKP